MRLGITENRSHAPRGSVMRLGITENRSHAPRGSVDEKNILIRMKDIGKKQVHIYKSNERTFHVMFCD